MFVSWASLIKLVCSLGTSITFSNNSTRLLPSVWIAWISMFPCPVDVSFLPEAFIELVSFVNVPSMK